MTSHRIAEVLAGLGAESRTPVAPHVAARLDRAVGGDLTALAQVAAVLRPEHLAGTALLPDPLPTVPAGRSGRSGAALEADGRRVLLCAAVAVTDRADVLVRAVGPSVRSLLDGPAAAGIELADGRFRVVDAPLRCLVHDDADLAARTAAHVALARASRECGEHGAALWHTALSTVAGDALLADGLVELAAALADRGAVEAAEEVAREAASHGTGERRARAFLAAGRAALWGGHLVDAEDWLRRAAGCDVPSVARAAEHCAAAVGALRAGSTVAGAAWAAVRPAGPGARLARLVEPLVHVTASRADRAAMTGIVGCLRVLDTDAQAAAERLAGLVLGLEPAPPRPGRWPRATGALSPTAEAHVRVVQALLLLRTAAVEEAATVLDDAVVRLPVAHVAGGLAAVLCRRLDALDPARTDAVATALESTGPRWTEAAVAAAGGAAPAARGAAGRTSGQMTGRPPLLAIATSRRAAGAATTRARPGRSGWSSLLTAREEEVAGLVAAGMTNREVAAALCVSVRTVEVHLSRAFRKLGVRTRSELVVLALTPAGWPVVENT
ncbi:hypothetical protein GCM10009718_35430 [Isoptericola halotolerans]|uniref:DNA-binding CsgD family transcriptional regulator n=1 Tax=Isoptericola halotolerans TaxID=300560 RepID=A0ABX2A311_9MICO|nr:helix-turn-helix transcriptional regulator [Isoptericola halotolerans]NOV97189.1 DNA-binding CsgD family transcriptional regulator [Isoptericola halotolerans]